MCDLIINIGSLTLNLFVPARYYCYFTKLHFIIPMLKHTTYVCISWSYHRPAKASDAKCQDRIRYHSISESIRSITFAFFFVPSSFFAALTSISPLHTYGGAKACHPSSSAVMLLNNPCFSHTASKRAWPSLKFSNHITAAFSISSYSRCVRSVGPEW